MILLWELKLTGRHLRTRKKYVGGQRVLNNKRQLFVLVSLRVWTFSTSDLLCSTTFLSLVARFLEKTVSYHVVSQTNQHIGLLSRYSLRILAYLLFGVKVKWHNKAWALPAEQAPGRQSSHL